MQEKKPSIINYVKRPNKELFSDFRSDTLLNIYNSQNFIPLYKKYFCLNQKNYNQINLATNNYLLGLNKQLTHNMYLCNIAKDNKVSNEKVFFKFSPLLDPVKYLIGKYQKKNDINIKALLPVFNNDSIYSKIDNYNNAAYVDSFFSFLASKLLHNNNFVHALDFYGSYLGIQTDYKYDISDDIEYLQESDFFIKNIGKLYKISEQLNNDVFNFDSRTNKTRLKLNSSEHNICDIINNIEILNLDTDEVSVSELSEIYNDGNCKKRSESVNDSDNKNDSGNDSGNDSDNDSSNDSGNDSDNESNCSSRYSDTDSEQDKESKQQLLNDLNLDSDDSDYEESYDDETDDNSETDELLTCTIHNFPVNIIALENMENTLDKLLLKHPDIFPDDELGSMCIQVIMMLLYYDKTFSLTHNDLHTNNIMYVKTDLPYLYYKYKDQYYKVPTYGRIYKIIDFGRAIYTFKGITICSDSYHKQGDAATLYNFGEYMNPSKPRIEPNKSFDLCRLGCSMVEFIADDLQEDPKYPNYGARRIIMDWCIDDKDKNILYKNNGEERYPDFKLYKMIARTVHNHTPDKELVKPYFNKFRVIKKKISKNAKIMNIDNLDSYV